MKYIIVEKLEYEDLISVVAKEIANGYVPLGGVAVTTWATEVDGGSERHWLYTQAMVREAQ